MSEDTIILIGWIAVIWMICWSWWRCVFTMSRLYTLPAYMLVLWREHREKKQRRTRLRDVR